MRLRDWGHDLSNHAESTLWYHWLRMDGQVLWFHGFDVASVSGALAEEETAAERLGEVLRTQRTEGHRLRTVCKHGRNFNLTV